MTPTPNDCGFDPSAPTIGNVPSPGEADDLDRQSLLAAFTGILEESSFSTDDLRFLFVILTMAMATRPAAFFEQLRTSAASRPASGDR